MLVQRLGMDNQKSPEYIEILIKELKQNDGCCDEIWLTTDYGYPTIDGHKQSANALLKTTKILRENGFKVSLQVANTIGHGDSMSAKDCSGLVYDGSPVKKYTGLNGDRSEYSFCWNDEFFREYISKTLLAYAEIQPDVLWFDDDFRIFHHGKVAVGCFCDDCIKKFNLLNNSKYSREDLKTLFYSDENVRKAYLNFCSNGFVEFLRYVLPPFHQASPNTKVGLQYGDMLTELSGVTKSILVAMKEICGTSPLVRPGGGVYRDYNVNDIINKSMHINWLNHNLPEFVEEKLPEIENLPDVVFGKSGAGTCLESTLYLANGGNTGLTYAMIMRNYESFDYHSQIFSQFKKHREYWQKLAEINKNTVQGGINFVYADDTLKGNPDKSINSVSDLNVGVYNGMTDFSRLGIPIAYDGKKKRGAYFLNKYNAGNLTDEMIQKLIKSPVVCDAYAFNIINEKYNISDIKYIQMESVNASKVYMRYADHVINNELVDKGYPKSFYRPTLYNCVDYEKPSIEILSYYGSKAQNFIPLVKGKYPYGISDCIVTIKSGVKWAVFGSDLTNPTISFDRRNQILRTIEYICPNTNNVYLESKIQAMLMPRETYDGKLKSVSVMNMTLGESGDIVLKIKNPVSESFSYKSQYKKDETVLVEKITDNEYRLTLPSLAAYTIGTLFID